MKLSRYTFLTGTVSALAFVLAGCGGGGNDDMSSSYDPIPDYSSTYESREVLPSPDKQSEVITYAYKKGYTPAKIIYRAYGDQSSAIIQDHSGNTPGSDLYYQGDKNYFFWAPGGHKLYAMAITYNYNLPHATALLMIEPSLVTTNGTAQVDTKETSFSTKVLEDFDANNFDASTGLYIRRTYTYLYPTGFSADGTSLLYSRLVTTNGVSVTTNYAYDYRTGINTEVTP